MEWQMDSAGSLKNMVMQSITEDLSKTFKDMDPVRCLSILGISMTAFLKMTSFLIQHVAKIFI
jgi:hypothetical protein